MIQVRSLRIKKINNDISERIKYILEKGIRDVLERNVKKFLKSKVHSKRILIIKE